MNRMVREFKFAKAQKLILKLTFISKTTNGKFAFSGAIDTDCKAWQQLINKNTNTNSKRKRKLN
jgi:hypothetical protein